MAAMLRRILVAVWLALSAFAGSTGAGEAAVEDWNRGDVMVVTAAAVAALMLFLTVVFAVKWYLGLAEGPLPEPEEHGGHH